MKDKLRHNENLDVISYSYQNSCTSIRKFILLNGGDMEDVKDISHDTFEVILRNRSCFLRLPAKKRYSYIIGISRNLWLKEILTRKKIRKSHHELIQFATDDDDFTNKLKQKKREIFYKCLNKLKLEDRQIIISIKKGMKNNEIAYKYGYKRSTFKKRKKDCLQSLFEIIKKDVDYVNILEQ